MKLSTAGENRKFSPATSSQIWPLTSVANPDPFLTPGSGMGKKSRTGSRMNIPDHFWQKTVAASSLAISKPFFYIFLLWFFLTKTLSTILVFARSAQLSPLSPSPPPSELCTYWWRQKSYQISKGCLEKKNYGILTVTVLILFAFLNLILDAPRTMTSFLLICRVHSIFGYLHVSWTTRPHKKKLAHLDCRTEGGGCSGQLTGGSPNYRQDWCGGCLHSLLHLQVQIYYSHN